MKTQKILLLFIVFLVLAITSFQSFYQLGTEHIKIWDEARGANNAIEMMQNHDYLVVKFDGQPDRWNTKSPFFIWFKVISFKIFGITEFAVRFPSALFAMLTSLVLLIFSKKIFNEIYTGAIAVLVMMNTIGYMGYHVARNGEPDTILVFFTLLYSLSWFLLLEKYPKRSTLLFFAFAVNVFFATFTKNIAGLAPLSGIVLYTLVRYKILCKLIKDYRTYLSILSIFGLVILYFIIREKFDPGYTQIVIKQEVTGMFFDYFVGKPKHPEFIFYFKYLFKNGFYQFVYFLLLSIPALILTKNTLRRNFIIFNIFAALIFVIGYSSSVAKNEWYIAPVYPFLSLIIGTSLVELVNITYKKTSNKYLKYFIIFLLIVPFSWVTINNGRSTHLKNMPKNSVYKYEADGHYLKKYHLLYPEINDIVVLSPYYSGPKDPNLDQVKFYIKKYNIEDNTNFSVQDNFSDDLIGKHVLICNTIYVDDLYKKYDYEIIDFNTQCIFCKILNEKQNFDNSLEPITTTLGSTSQPYFLKIDDYNFVYPFISDSLIALKIDDKNNKIYMWYLDSTLNVVNLENDTINIISEKFIPSPGYSTMDISNLAIDTDKDSVYVYYADNKVSVGTVFDFGYKFYNVTYPEGNDANTLIDCAIEQNGNHFYFWFNTGVVSSGTFNDLAKYRDLYNIILPSDILYSKILFFNISKSEKTIMITESD
ncbi:MAG: glycosyltransferase family 39 protein [Bacteroidales bacterium]|nr:glycosyltransferase family 39 protein [Bacteroidales bacterium]